MELLTLEGIWHNLGNREWEIENGLIKSLRLSDALPSEESVVKSHCDLAGVVLLIAYAEESKNI